VNVYDVVDRLPSIEVLRDRCRALAVLELIQGSDYAYYTYGKWGHDAAALMSNGSGDEYSIVFSDVGVFIRVFDHESDMTPYANDDHALCQAAPPQARANSLACCMTSPSVVSCSMSSPAMPSSTVRTKATSL
jgi:hypothetical protein